METASLRIKFTPLLKKRLHNESKCSLEIVPEVTCIQNLDKISWKQEDDMIEYTVPMTYKIILKRREIVKKNDDDLVMLEKIYHSCVDLLPPSSMTVINFASGDVTRNISDTYVLGRISIDDDNNEINDDLNEAIKAHVTSQQNNCPKENPILINKNKTAVIVEDDNERNNIHNNVITIASNKSDTLVDKYSLDIITNTENKMILSEVTQSVETITDITTRSRDDFTRKLTLSPICSIDTNDNAFPDSLENIVPFNSVVQHEKSDFIGDLANKHPNKNKLEGAIKIAYGNASVQNLIYRKYNRELPQARVAKFVKKMETEIMPLKILLNDILRKCSRLGLNQTKFIARNLILYKTLPGSKNQIFSAMDNDSIVEQIVRSLSFEVEAVPQDNIIQVTTSSKSAPLNVRIRVRKKENAGFQHGVISLAKPQQVDTIPERIRLVSSDQTIMSFNVVMEADFHKPVKKPRKNILGIFKPTICLGAQPDEDDYAYMPSATDQAEINGENTSKSDGALTKLTLSKNVDDTVTSSTLSKRNKDIFGKCKPGGCLDPPFGEEKYPYTPKPPVEKPSNVKTATKTRTSSIFSNGIFSRKKKNHDNEQLENNVIQKEPKTESVLDLFQAGSLQTSATYSNSIITYPPTLNSSDLRIQEGRQRDSKTFNTISKNSFNVQSGSYFVLPKKQIKSLDNKNTVILRDEVRDNISKVAVITGKSLPRENNVGIPHLKKDDEYGGISKIDNFKTKPDKNVVQDHKKEEVGNLKTKESTTDIRDSKEFSLKSRNPYADQTECRDKTDNWGTMSKNPEEKSDCSTQQKKTDHDLEFILDPSTVEKYSKTSQENITDAMTKDTSDHELILESPHDSKKDKRNIEEPQLTEHLSEDYTFRDQKSSENIITQPSKQNETKNMTDDLALLQNTSNFIRLPERQILKTTKGFEDKFNLEIELASETPNIDHDAEHKILSEDKKQHDETKGKDPIEQIELFGSTSSDSISVNDMQPTVSKPHLEANLASTIAESPNMNVLTEKQHIKTNNMDPIQYIQTVGTSINNSKLDNDNQAPAVQPDIENNSADLLKPNNIVKNSQTDQRISDDHKKIGKPAKIYLLSETQYDKTKAKDPMEKNQLFGSILNDSKLLSDNEAAAVQTHLEDGSDDLFKPNIVVNNYKTNDLIGDDHNIKDELPKVNLLSELQTKGKDPIEKVQLFGTSVNDLKSDSINPAALKIPQLEDDSGNLLKPNNMQINDKSYDFIIDDHNIDASSDKNLRSEKQHDKTNGKDPLEQNRLLDTNIYDSKLSVNNQIAESRTHLEADLDSLLKSEKLEIYNKLNGLISDNHKIPANFGPKEVETILPSAVTLNAQHEVATIDLTATYDENIKTITGLRNVPLEHEISKYRNDEGTTANIPTPIERDTLLDISYIENDDLEHIWNNKTQPLESDIRFQDVKVLKNLTDQYKKQVDTLAEEDNTENTNGPSLRDIPHTELTQTYLEDTNDQNYFQSENERKMARNGLPLNLIKQNIRSNPTKLNRSDSKSKIYKDNLSQSSKNPERKQNLFDRPNANNKGSNESGLTHNYQENNVHRLADLKSDVSEDDSKETQHDKNIMNAQQPQVKDSKTPEVKTRDRNNIDVHKQSKKITFDTELFRSSNDKTLPIITEQAKSSLPPQIDSALRSTDYEGIITPNEVAGFNKITRDEINKSGLVPIFKLNLGLQSYVDDNNEVIVKSFDLDKTPKRYPNDTIKVTSSYLATDNEIKIPINSENDLCIQIKCKQLKDITDINERKLEERTDTVETGKTGNATTNKNNDESIQRNIIIADDIKRTLVAVYEDELLPLRNTIAELKENMEILTSHHMRLKGHMFVKKPRSSKVVPMYRKCGCIRR